MYEFSVLYKSDAFPPRYGFYDMTLSDQFGDYISDIPVEPLTTTPDVVPYNSLTVYVIEEEETTLILRFLLTDKITVPWEITLEFCLDSSNFILTVSNLPSATKCQKINVVYTVS